jgi:hypothetical protein
LLNTVSKTNLTSVNVPQLALEEGTTYCWRVKIYDQYSNPSEWSPIFSFTTIKTENNLNENGIPDAQEVDETVDLDRDGIPDIQQEDIKSLNTVVGEGHMGISRRNHPKVRNGEIPAGKEGVRIELTCGNERISSSMIKRPIPW